MNAASTQLKLCDIPVSCKCQKSKQFAEATGHIQVFRQGLRFATPLTMLIPRVPLTVFLVGSINSKSSSITEVLAGLKAM